MERYKLPDFAKWARSEGITDDLLNHIIDEMQRGLLGAYLGTELYKKRVALAGRGKRGGARTIVIFRRHEFIVFIYGFTKNEKRTLRHHELEALRVYAKAFVKLSRLDRANRVTKGALVPIDKRII